MRCLATRPNPGKPLLCLALATVLAFLLSGCGRLADKPVSIALNIWVGYEPMFLARNEGWLDARRVHLVETASSTDSLQALAEGKLDALVTYEPLASQLLAQGANKLFDSRQIPNTVVDVLPAFRGLWLPDAPSNHRLLTGAPPQLLDTARKVSALMVEKIFYCAMIRSPT